MIIATREGGLLTLTLNRADKRNALTADMLGALDAAIADAGDLRALIITGAGSVFSAGADFGEMQAGLGGNPVWQRLSDRIAALPCLTIAALNGTLAGGAMGMALACDLRIAVPSAMVFYPVMRLGFLPQPDDPARLMALIGPARAKMILLAGARIDAAQAMDWGLIDRIVAGDDLIPQARALVADALGATANHLATIKRMVPSG